jgi:hypothetical protein
MNTKQRLEDLRNYYAATRQCGHTTAMVRGAQNVDTVAILAASQDHARTLKQMAPKADCISLYAPTALRGMRKPLLVDNHTMHVLLSDALQEIERLEKRVSDLSNVTDERHSAAKENL